MVLLLRLLGLLLLALLLLLLLPPPCIFPHGLRSQRVLAVFRKGKFLNYKLYEIEGTKLCKRFR